MKILIGGFKEKLGRVDIFKLTAGNDSLHQDINPLTPNDHYSGRTAPLISKRCISYIYS